MALELARAGARIGLGYRDTDLEAAERIANEVLSLGGEPILLGIPLNSGLVRPVLILYGKPISAGRI